MSPAGADGVSKLKKAMLRAEQADAGWPAPQAGPGFEPTPPAGAVPEPAPAQAPSGRLRALAGPFVFERPELSEHFRVLRTRVLNGMEEIGGNTLLVTSARPGEGKTFTAANLAVSLSHEPGRSAWLVDANARNPSVARCFGIDSAGGLAEYLSGQGEIDRFAVSAGNPALTVVPAGRSLRGSAEGLGGHRMQAFLSRAKERRPDRLLILDGDALLVGADALVLARVADGVLLVVEAERTALADVRKAMGLIADKPVLGIVYNKS